MKTITAEQLIVVNRLFVDKKVPLEQVQKLIDSGFLADLCDANLDEMNRDGFRKACGLKSLDDGEPTSKKTPTLLEPTSTVVSVPATTELFIAKEQFPGNQFWQSTNFQNWFGDKTEEPRPASELQIDRLTTKVLVDAPIIAALGGEERAETALSEMKTFLQSADRNHWYLFYIKDVNGVLRTVHAYWDGGRWYLDAYSVEYPYWWHAGRHVVSRKSVAV